MHARTQSTNLDIGPADLDFVEIRVHGVSGTPPTSMLQLASDRRTLSEGDVGTLSSQPPWSRFYHRLRPPTGPEVAGAPTVMPPSESAENVESFDWSVYTSARGWQSLWVLIVPLGLVNASQFMLPDPGVRASARFWHAMCGGLLRLVALAQTVILLFGAALVSVYFVGYQIADAAAVDRHWIAALCAALPIGVLVLFSFLGRRSRIPLGQVEELLTAGPDPTAKLFPDSPMSGLAREGFLRGDPDAPTLRRLHLAAGVLGTVTVCVAPAAGSDSVALWLTRAGLTALVVVVVVVVMLGDPEGTSSQFHNGIVRAWHRIARWLSWLLVVCAIAAIAGLIYWAATPSTEGTSWANANPGGVFDLAATLLQYVGLGALALLLIVNGGLARCTPSASLEASGARTQPGAFRRYAFGMTGGIAAGLGLSLTVGFAAAFVVLMRLVLSLVQHIVVPYELQACVYSWGAGIFVTLLAAIGVCLRWRFKSAPFVTAAGRNRVDITARQMNKAAGAMFVARLKNGLWVVVAGYAGLSVLLAVFTTLAVRLHWGLPVSDVFGFVGTGFLTLLSIGIGWVVVRGYGNRSTRRGLNIIWDIVSFWPRSVQPLVPASYGQYAVGTLEYGVSEQVAPTSASPGASDGPPRATRAVVAGHSQGSLISLATLLRFPPERRKEIGFLSFGSQIQVIFARAFPAYVNVDVLQWLWGEYGHRWVSLYRDTDHLAGPVLSWNHGTIRNPLSAFESTNYPDCGPQRQADDITIPGVRKCGNDWRLVDPPAWPGTQDLLRRHSGYFLDANWVGALDSVRVP